MASDTDINIVGRIVREARNRKGWKQSDLAAHIQDLFDDVKVAQQRISKIERAQISDPGIRELTRIAEALDIDPDALRSLFDSRPVPHLVAS